MSVREILEIGHPALRAAAQSVDPSELGTEQLGSLVQDLIETMRDAKGAGLAATQIGVSKRVCVIEVADNPRYPYKPEIPLTVLINPQIEMLVEDTFDNYEGCLSVPNLRGVVARSTEIRVRALTPDGEVVDRVVRGLSAGTYQHEVDHLDGMLFVDRVRDTSTLCTWQIFAEYFYEGFAKRASTLVERYGE